MGDSIEEKYTKYLYGETDILELTIEEAIFIFEICEEVPYVDELLQKAGKVILSDYKKILKENEELKEYKRISESTKISCCTAYIAKQKIKDKIEEYLKYDKEHNTYTKDGRKVFTMEYFKAKALQELLEEE